MGSIRRKTATERLFTRKGESLPKRREKNNGKENERKG